MDQDDRTEERDENTKETLGHTEPEPTGTTGTDADLQKEGNLGNERNLNEPDSEQLPGGNREKFNQ